jgi:hypothetical protein
VSEKSDVWYALSVSLISDKSRQEVEKVTRTVKKSDRILKKLYKIKNMHSNSIDLLNIVYSIC